MDLLAVLIVLACRPRISTFKPRYQIEKQGYVLKRWDFERMDTSNAYLQEKSTALSLALKRTEDVILRKDKELESAKRAEFNLYGGYTSEFHHVPSKSATGRINTRPAGARISAFCQDESPRKYLRRLAMMRGSTAPRLLITSTNLVFPDPPSLTRATLFLATQRRRSQRWCPNDAWTKVQEGTRHEVITERDGEWFYLGTYVAAEEPRMVDPRAFVSMADETLAEPDGAPLSGIAGMYGRGLLRALRIDLEYAGYNEELARELARAVSKRRCPHKRKGRKRGSRQLDGAEGDDTWGYAEA
ncbi:hypothetical protein GLOTRDRAFT_126096 [Gloeophyllum trabeum ATCC 11539]|uniref:Uncharacterized protein n=1 Tax=Gloeophyllum trabeum (strain ATCC 11539 / FP-39264 / Madison 617) TaxID=670483 RepID=S7S1Z8_GLOTA|nr:uncharacterized protein GLOTRDRAFT_126096 [Gloeophyllum trabeum ATCC 11539]EPQ59799.1 hypothetical protein GLOTRDRAFT_126096 [Gloeophyllum trabeum ATCC 11539]